MRKEPPLPKELWDRIPPDLQATIWVVVEGYKRRIAALEAEVTELKERLKQNSSNSSRPPSSDAPAVKRQPPRASSGRKTWCPTAVSLVSASFGAGRAGKG